MRSGIEAIRDKAWDAVKASEAYAVFAALDAAVVAAGGQARLASPTATIVKTPIAMPVTHAAVGYANSTKPRKLSQAEAAYIGLRKADRPMPVGDLMEAATVEGAAIGGSDPLANFRSALSKDTRFRSIMRKGQYFWWFADAALPSKWNDPEPDDFESLMASGSSFSSNQEGGDGHGPATT